MKVKCGSCGEFKNGFKLIIEHEDKILNSTKKIILLTCFDCLADDPVIKISFTALFRIKPM